MSSIPRSLSRLLRKHSPTTATATPKTRPSTPIRTAQTQAAPSALKGTPPPSFQHQHGHNHSHNHQKPNTSATTTQSNTTPDITANHPILHTFRRDPNLKETRPHLSMPAKLRPSHFVAGSLSGEGKLISAPYMFVSRRSTAEDERDVDQPRQSRAVTVFHTGRDMCGHPGYVHGGFLSVMFDEVFAHCVSQSFRSGTGMTANLNVDFRKPALPGRVYVLRAETVKVEGRKAWVEGTMTMMPTRAAGDQEEAVLVAEARALFVEPRFAESMVPVYRN
ncbi:HotDog domain-containing protein [Aspergillus aurantiobrunneus]